MQVARLAHETDFDGWRKAARAFRLEGIPPEMVAFRVGEQGQGGLFDALSPAHPREGGDPVLSSGELTFQDKGSAKISPEASPKELGPRLRGDERKKEQSFAVPKAFVDLAQAVILHRSNDRFDLLYRLLWRLRTSPI